VKRVFLPCNNNGGGKLATMEAMPICKGKIRKRKKENLIQ